MLDEQFHDTTDADLLFVVEAPEPSREFVRALNPPTPRGNYAIQGIIHQGLYSEASTMRLAKRDVVLWLRHLQDVGMPVPPGRSAVFRVGDADILFQRMRPGPSGRATPGLRAAGANRAVWSSIPLRTVIDLELVRVLPEDSPAPLAGVGEPRLSRTYQAASPKPSGAAKELFGAVALGRVAGAREPRPFEQRDRRFSR